MIKSKTLHVTLKFDTATQLSRVILECAGKKLSVKEQTKDQVHDAVKLFMKDMIQEVSNAPQVQ